MVTSGSAKAANFNDIYVKLRGETSNYISPEDVHLDGDSVSVKGTVRLLSSSTGLIEIKFGITGDFSCRGCHLESLKNSPHETMLFDCSKNDLKSLIDGPKTVDGDYYVHDNPLSSIEGLASFIKGKLVIPYSRTLPVLRIFGSNVGYFDFGLNWTGNGREVDRKPATETRDILRKGLIEIKQGMSKKKVLWDCQTQIIALGLDDNAKW
jgi:hypothetical protein